MSYFWFNQTAHLATNHLIKMVDNMDSIREYFPTSISPPESLIGRSMITLKAKVIPVECVARGYISGSAWEEYKMGKAVNDIILHSDLKESEKLSEPIFTPTTKAEAGHDMPLSNIELENLIGKDLAKMLKEKTITIYQHAHDYAWKRGIIIADTKFEFGFYNDELIIIDEMLTPDSSRFWDISHYTVGQSQPSLDKQPIRDWLSASGWDMNPPAPELPSDVINATTDRYREAHERLTGRTLEYVSG
jgi:phosphoribosylaminoimidazole-succinocarboxamide synthase